MRVPNRSATLPLAGMNTARLSRYAVSATFICNGSTPNVRAMVGRAVASTVPSNCSMNSALATISAVVRTETWDSRSRDRCRAW